MAQSAEQLTFDFLPQIPLVVQRQPGLFSSDGGLLPFRQLDQRWRYTQRMADCLIDFRVDPTHSLLSMLRQRLFGLLAGYEDCNDHDALRDDPLFKLLADRLPRDPALAGQSTLCRLENALTPAMLQNLVDFLIRTGIQRLKHLHGGTLPASLTLDLDATDDPAHGNQQLVLFHGFYGQHQYLPLVISEPTSKHVFLVWLRPGTAPAALGADEDLLRVVRALRQERPDIQIPVRGDGGFGVPAMYRVCEDNGLSYTFGLSTNERLKALSEPLLRQAQQQYRQTQQKQRLFETRAYQAESWAHPRTVVTKAECHAAGTNRRHVVTNLATADALAAEARYDEYVQRGESEQRMDELKNGLSLDRLSCHRFLANFWRLLLHTAAYNLFNAVRRLEGAPAEMQVAQPQTWRTTLMKVAVEVIASTRRIVIKLAKAWPNWELYERLSLGALQFSGSG